MNRTMLLLVLSNLVLTVPVATFAQEPRIQRAAAADSTRALVVVSPLKARAPTPSTVRTAERFTAVYEVRALRLTDDGEVKFRTDLLTPSLGDFKLESVQITEIPTEEEYRVWNVAITAYIVNAQKSNLAKGKEYKIPPIKFSYQIVPVGVAEEGIKVREMWSVEVPVMYVSSVAENTKYPDIQDGFEDAFPRYESLATWAGYYGWFVLLLFVVWAALTVRSVKNYFATRGPQVALASEDLIPDEVYAGPAVLSRTEAHRRFRRSLYAFGQVSDGIVATEAMQREVQRDIRGLIKMVLLAEIPGAKVGLTDEEVVGALKAHASASGIREAALNVFADRLSLYKRCIDTRTVHTSFANSADLRAEIKALKKAARKLGWPWSWISRFQAWFRVWFDRIRGAGSSSWRR
jgi:hypothetical protein